MSENELLAILLVPDRNGPYKLLQDGPCGACPPAALRVKGLDGQVKWRAAWQGSRRSALTLAWDGIPVQMGIWIATATLPICDIPDLQPFYSMKQVEALAQIFRAAGLGTIVKLYANGEQSHE